MMILLQLVAIVVLFTSFFATGTDGSLALSSIARRCNSLNPRCGLSATQAQLRFLTSYDDLVRAIQQIKSTARVPISTGPLIRHEGRGLLDIDAPLDKSLSPAVKIGVCGAGNPNPTIREAVICTVTQDAVQPPRGNVDPAQIGFSTQGKALLALRLGNPNGTRVLIATQQHGNEAASTEAALSVLKKLTRQTGLARKILPKLDLLFLLRANPDASEPAGNNNPPVGVPYNETTGFFRHNIDPRAGGGFLSETEEDFFGVVGRGYDLNRYNYGGLNNAIRPVESQAMVAAVHAFRPHILFDLHGDIQKVFCELDPASIVPNAILGILPSVKCKPPADPVPTLLTQRKNMVMGGLFADDATVLTGDQTAGLKSGPLFGQNVRLVRSIVAEVVKRADPVLLGRITRFSQIQLSAGSSFTDGSLDRTALALGAVGTGWDVPNFGTDGKPSVSALQLVDGVLTAISGLDNPDIEPCFMRDNICINKLLLRKSLFAVTKFIGKRLLGDNGYCTIPLDDASLVRAPASSGVPPELSFEDIRMFPNGGQFGVPSAIAGSCAGD